MEFKEDYSCLKGLMRSLYRSVDRCETAASGEVAHTKEPDSHDA